MLSRFFGGKLPPGGFRFRIGMRIWKSALCVLICLAVAQLLGQPYPFYACIAAVICMQDSVERSASLGRTRLIATGLGGIIGLLFLLATRAVTATPVFDILVALSIVVTLYVCSLLKPEAAAMACIVLLSITLNHAQDNPVLFAFWRMAETAFGVVVAVVVNRFVLPPRHKPGEKEYTQTCGHHAPEVHAEAEDIDM